jgi:hypothetical protein
MKIENDEELYYYLSGSFAAENAKLEITTEDLVEEINF